MINAPHFNNPPTPTDEGEPRVLQMGVTVVMGLKVWPGDDIASKARSSIYNALSDAMIRISHSVPTEQDGEIVFIKSAVSERILAGDMLARPS